MRQLYMAAQGQHAVGALGDAYGRAPAQASAHAAAPGYSDGGASGYGQYSAYADPASAHGTSAHNTGYDAGEPAGYDASGYADAQGRGAQVRAAFTLLVHLRALLMACLRRLHSALLSRS